MGNYCSWYLCWSYSICMALREIFIGAYKRLIQQKTKGRSFSRVDAGSLVCTVYEDISIQVGIAQLSGRKEFYKLRNSIYQTDLTLWAGKVWSSFVARKKQKRGICELMSFQFTTLPIFITFYKEHQFFHRNPVELLSIIKLCPEKQAKSNKC